MLIKWYKIKTICSYNYRDRGRHSRERNYDIKHRTDFGRWLIGRRIERIKKKNRVTIISERRNVQTC